MLTRIKSLDRRVIYLVLVIVMAIPFIKPVRLPLSISEETESAFRRVDNLKPGDVVVVLPNYSPNARAENHPQLEAIMAHVLSKPGMKIITASFWEMGPLFARELWDTLGNSDLTYGEDYVDLGYVPGGETAMSAFANDIHKTFPVDQYGTPVGEIPLMQSVRTAADITLIISSESGTPGTPELVRQIQNPFKTDLIGGYAAQFAPTYMPYFDSGQIKGLLAGLRGAAEYELLTAKPGQGSSGFGSVTFAMLTVIAFVILANIVYFTDEKQSSKGGSSN
ncbi:MAG: hypothetical protein ACOX4K_05385 [Bacillota bacterium]